MASSISSFVLEFRSKLGMYVAFETFLNVCTFIDGYRWGKDDRTFGGFVHWMQDRGHGRPELAWPWLVLCELYPSDSLPDIRTFTEQQDKVAISLMFDLLEEYYGLTRKSLITQEDE